jgi:hypothetical protein
MNALIERVEGATGPDRELDMLIENALGLAKFERDPRVGYGDADYNRVAPKPLTASLDAAMTLTSGMPEYTVWAIWHEALRECSKAGADLVRDLPRFIVAAALKARAQSTGENGHG